MLKQDINLIHKKKSQIESNKLNLALYKTPHLVLDIFYLLSRSTVSILHYFVSREANWHRCITTLPCPQASSWVWSQEAPTGALRKEEDEVRAFPGFLLAELPCWLPLDTKVHHSHRAGPSLQVPVTDAVVITAPITKFKGTALLLLLHICIPLKMVLPLNSH